MILTFPISRRIAELVERLERRPCPPPLIPQGVADSEVQEILDRTPLDGLFEGTRVVSADFARAVQSGLYLWNDSLDVSHGIAQKIDTETGSYWHALMHRREPDYSNSKYWWRKVGEHDLFPQVCAAALKVLSETQGGWGVKARQSLEARGWQPADFVDWCEACASGQFADARPLLERIQAEEIRLLLGYSYRRAVVA